MQQPRAWSSWSDMIVAKAKGSKRENFQVVDFGAKRPKVIWKWANDRDSGFGGALGYGSSVCSSSSKRDYDVAEHPRKLDLDGSTPFEKNFYVKSPSVAAMSEKEVEEYRLQREITVEG
ncbi:hypothetical protein Dsin_014165 [Dipteronia sinensis]|uniref:Uncharacterized protein n=1 Tax=Dipteronia sinensis TaxID=43782 RepID=A0AAE0EBB4_9ROSI|nr:hypothetical protein Dsin_014162 [Dipteronia sinensis]KAK3220195.1 hypothetical protein Dsin_014165 [Dipteronia sinensis]